MTEATATETATAPKKRRTPALRKKKGRPDLLGRFGSYLKHRRKHGNMSIRELARRAGTAHTNIFQFEKLRKNPRLTELAQLAQAFKEPLAKFLEPML